MARSPRSPSTSQQPGANRERATSPFDVLAALRGRHGRAAGGGQASASPTPTRPPRSPRAAPTDEKPAATEGDLGPAEIALFHAAVDDATPLPSTDRIELEPPKPPPIPRPRATQAETAEPSPRRRGPAPDDDEALFRAALEDVIPLKDPGRLDIGPAPRRGRLSAPAAAAAFGAALPPVPTVTEPSDPGELFRHAVRGTQPLDQRNRVELEKPPPPPSPLKREADEDAALRESLEAPLTFEDHLDMGDEAAFLRPGLPRRVLTDLRRGRWVLQGELDLHGLTRDEAREALARFLSASLLQGRRCVRVIHGKGLGSPGRFGILKHLSRAWLSQREEILAFCQAGPHAGGSGALLVLLRAGTVGQNPPGSPDGRP